MIITKKHLPRRTVLRGLGATIALPLLDGMIPAFAARAATAPIKRFGAIYVGMGMNMLVWGQPNEGELQVNSILQPIAAHRNNLLVVAGLDNNQAVSTDGGQHPRAQSSWLTGSRAKRTDGPDIRLGTSLDQIIARESEKETQLGSLELGLEATDFAGSCAYGFSCAYNNTLAWRTPTTPLPTENNPRAVFERLFGASDSTDPKVRLRQIRADASILDSVTQQMSGVHRGLGPVDQQKLGEYADAIRDVERRLQKAEEQANKELPLVDQPVGIPPAFEDYARIMFDLQLLAFQTDLTRVFTYVMVRESGVRSYPEIGVPDSHHPLSHHQNNAEKLAKLAKINAFHVKQLGYFIDKLKATRELDGSLLDSTMMLYGSGMSDSNLHVPRNVPSLLVAGKNFGIKGNRFLNFPETPLSSLQLTITERFGLNVDHFGDSNGTLNRLAGV